MKKKESGKERKISSIITGIFLVLLAILLFVSTLVSTGTITFDMHALTSMSSPFIKFFTLDFPHVDNPIGPFGAIFAYWLISLTGRIWTYFIITSLLFAGIAKLFIFSMKGLLARSLSIVLIGFFANITIISLFPSTDWLSGLIVQTFYRLLVRVFNHTGTALVSGALTISFFFVLFGAEKMALFGNSILMLIKRAWFALLSSIRGLQSSRKEKREVEIEEAKADKSKKTVKPQIVDHLDYKEETVAEEPSFKDEDEVVDEDEPIRHKPIERRKKVVAEPSDSDVYQKPRIEDFLTSSAKVMFRDRSEMEAMINSTSKILIDKLAQFKVEAEVVNVNVGPIITQYELKPAPNIKVSSFMSLADDLALAIKAKSIRVQAPIPGRGLIGIEVPNKQREIIYLKDVLLSEQMEKNNALLTIALGKDIAGTPVVADLSRMPHLLIAGSTNSGKSVCINAVICNLLFNTTPDELRLILIDPKRVELSGYEGIPHLIQDIVADPEEALIVLNWAVSEMERRYELLQELGVRDIGSYNKRVKEQQPDEDEATYETLPVIVIVIDEFADLIMSSGRDIEFSITRLAQKARAIGIHLVLATQRPSIKIITGLIKANFPARIAFQVAQKVDSRVILDMNGAENLLGMGDMLFVSPYKSNPERIHGAFVSDKEIENLVAYLRTQPKPEQTIEIIDLSDDGFEFYDYDDELFVEAAKLVLSADSASVSMLQRHFKIGYARAGRLVDSLEKAKIIGKHVGSKSREVIATQEIIDAYKLDQ